MSGHSKWATTKHKKAAIDAKRGKLFARLIKNIEVAARTGGGDPAGNPTLFDAIQKAKKNSVPADNITRAVKRGSGAEGGGANYETIMYEGYGPNGVAFLVECLTDNRNRAASDVRLGFTRHGGSLADPGSVSYLFSRRGVIEVPAADGLDEDTLTEAVLDAGAEDVTDAGELFVIESDPSDLVAAVGPRICGKCYEVGEEVIEAMGKAGLSESCLAGGRRVDLGKANATLLARAGIPESRVEVIPRCTSCEREFVSWRRDRTEEERPFNFIVITGEG